MSTKIARISQISKEKPNEVFTSVYHLINYELLNECYLQLDGNKAVGSDKMSKAVYEQNKEENLNNLLDRLKNKAYRPTPARKVEIPKTNGKLRCLAIANFEDKIVQLAVKKLVEAIFEPVFRENMYGFRPNTGCHKALKYLNWCIESKPTNYILDADIKGYFDNIDHDKLIKCLETKIKDKNLIRLIRRFLKAGILKNGIYYECEVGTPQGSILSPVLANIYMYYSLVLWFERIKKEAKGFVEIINYADDMVICFQYENEAKQIYNKMKQRLKQAGLEFADDKTRLIEFGKFALFHAKQKGKKPKTFDFLGFTHYCSRNNKTGQFRVKRKTSKKKLKKAIQEFDLWIKQNRNQKLGIIMTKVKQKLTGHYNYFGITDNSLCLGQYMYAVLKSLIKWLNKRSQRPSYTWEEFLLTIKIFKLPKPRIMVNIYDI